MTVAAVPWWRAAVLCRCPRCGDGRLYAGLLTIRERCERCGLDLRASDAGDGAPFAVMSIVSLIVVVLAFWVEFRFSPPLWVHGVLWIPLTLVLSIALMRPAKAALVALQYRNRASEMGL